MIWPTCLSSLAGIAPGGRAPLAAYVCSFKAFCTTDASPWSPAICLTAAKPVLRLHQGSLKATLACVTAACCCWPRFHAMQTCPTCVALQPEAVDSAILGAAINRAHRHFQIRIDRQMPCTENTSTLHNFCPAWVSSLGFLIETAASAQVPHCSGYHVQEMTYTIPGLLKSAKLLVQSSCEFIRPAPA